jgi:DNA polymerase-3 subunit chi
MTERVDFYVLDSSTNRQRWTFACRLTEKAYLRDLNVVLLSDTVAEAEALDELLWTFTERSFVPHDLRRARPAADDTLVTAAARRGAPPASAAPVQLTPDLDAIETADLLVNLSDRLPSRLERFARIAEIVDADAARRARGRERYKAYRELNLPVDTHQLDHAAGA